MPYINLPPTVSEMFWGLEKRVMRLETAFRFNAPNINFNTSTPTNPRIGDIYYDTYNLCMKYWNGTVWVTLNDSNVGGPIISYSSVWSGTGLVFTGFPVTAIYQRTGKQVHFQITVNCATVTNFGTGQYSLTLPFAASKDYQIIGGLASGANHYVLLGDMTPNTTTMTLWHPTANGAQDIFSGSKPKNLTTSDTFYVSGNYIATT